jgi:hypothetical protein
MNTAVFSQPISPGFHLTSKEADMRTRTFPFLAVVFVLGFVTSVPLLARAMPETMTGWISDSICGAKGMSANHKACAIKCVKEKGAKWVFVDARTKTIYAIKNQESVNEEKDLGKEVQLTGEPAGKDTLEVATIVPATK